MSQKCSFTPVKFSFVRGTADLHSQDLALREIENPREKPVVFTSGLHSGLEPSPFLYSGMPRREIGSLSETMDEASRLIEWEIPDFFREVEFEKSRLQHEEEHRRAAGRMWQTHLWWETCGDIESPYFSSSGCSLTLQCVLDSAHKNWMSLGLRMEKSDIPHKDLTYSLGVKKWNGTLERIKTSWSVFPETGSICYQHHFLNLDDLQKRKSNLAPSDTLTLTCRIKECPTPQSLEVVPQPLKLMELETLSSNFKDLFTRKTKCDVTIKVKDKEFQVHKIVLMARSPVFAAMFEHDMSEERTRVVTVPDCDPESFGEFLHYLYTGMLEDISFRNAHHLYITADKYDVKELKSFCVVYMMRNLNTENFCDVITLAERYDETELSSSAQTFFNRNFGEIVLTAEWETLFKVNFRLVNRLLKEMAPKVKIQE